MGRALIVIIVMAIAMFGAFSMLPGCAAAPHSVDADVQPIYEPGTREARSLVSDSLPVRRHIARHGISPYEPWYHDRNDRSMSVSAGYRGPVYLSVESRVYDHQHTGGRGHVHDHYSQTTRRTRIFEGVR